MRAVHENAYKPKIQTNETKFIVNIRPINHSAAAKSVAVNNGGGTQVNRTDVGLHNVAAAAPAHNFIAEVNWRRIFTVSSLIVSILLISGSIYLHLKQKSHFGRLNLEQHISTTDGVASTPDSDDNTHNIASVASSSGSSVTREDNSFKTFSINTKTTAAAASAPNSMASIDSQTLKNTKKTSHAMDTTSTSSGSSHSRHITEACMQCICETTTQCRPSTCGNNVDCGIFRISRLYWLDAGKPALEGDGNNSSNITATYERCVNNIYCATRTVAAYINKYARDCNQDGTIECRDHITLHLLGPSGCVQAEGELLPVFTQRMKDCLTYYM